MEAPLKAPTATDLVPVRAATSHVYVMLTCAQALGQRLQWVSPAAQTHDGPSARHRAAVTDLRAPREHS
jgi:hypothetical protein